MAFIKGGTGYYGHSNALIADAIESSSDVLSSLIVLLGIYYSTRPADLNHPYGHGRAEPLVTFLITGFLVASASLIAYRSITQLMQEREMPHMYTLYVLAATIVAKEIFYRIVSQKGKETGSTVLEADAWHHRSDAITSLTAFAGISVAIIFGKGYEHADDWAALAAAAFILYNSYRVFRPALGEIMDEQLYDDLVSRIRAVSKTVDGVSGIEKCFVRKLGMQYHVDMHARVPGDISVRNGHDIAHQLKNTLMRELPEIADVHIHVEPA